MQNQENHNYLSKKYVLGTVLGAVLTLTGCFGGGSSGGNAAGAPNQAPNLKTYFNYRKYNNNDTIKVKEDRAYRIVLDATDDYTPKSDLEYLIDKNSDGTPESTESSTSLTYTNSELPAQLTVTVMDNTGNSTQEVYNVISLDNQAIVDNASSTIENPDNIATGTELPPDTYRNVIMKQLPSKSYNIR